MKILSGALILTVVMAASGSALASTSAASASVRNTDLQAIKTASPIRQMKDFVRQYCSAIAPLNRDAVSSLRVEFCTGYVAKPLTFGQSRDLMNHIAAKTGEALHSNPQLLGIERKVLTEQQTRADKLAADYMFDEVNQAFNAADM
jgi:hypothetical protein